MGLNLIYWLIVSRAYSFPMSIMSFLVPFIFGIAEGGNIFWGIIAGIGIIFAHAGVNMFDDLKDNDKIRLAIHLLEDLGFTPNYDINNFIKLLKNILLILDPESKNVITNFAKYENLVFISAKYMELSLEEKKKFSVEILFNIFQYDFKNEEINTKINEQLNVYDYCYSLNVL